MTDQHDLADDLLRGAPAIARFLHGSDGKEEIRRVYHEAATGRWPIFKEGGILFALKTRLRAHAEARSAEAEARIMAAAATAASKTTPPQRLQPDSVPLTTKPKLHRRQSSTTRSSG